MRSRSFNPVGKSWCNVMSGARLTWKAHVARPGPVVTTVPEPRVRPEIVELTLLLLEDIVLLLLLEVEVPVKDGVSIRAGGVRRGKAKR